MPAISSCETWDKARACAQSSPALGGMKDIRGLRTCKRSACKLQATVWAKIRDRENNINIFDCGKTCVSPVHYTYDPRG
ncbi:hypothetical protein NL676_008048 [Syzygium grande]|nr:hypothetical protein NL676_008048 [Syzygium grande]